MKVSILFVLLTVMLGSAVSASATTSTKINKLSKGEDNELTKGGKYTGNFKDGIKDGLGSMGFITGARYEGMWSQGRMHGKGLYIWADGRRYEGEWVRGERHGAGMSTMANGEKHEGGYIHNQMNGAGWWRFTSGKVRPGEWRDDKLLRWTGPEQFEAQMKAKRLLKDRK